MNWFRRILRSLFGPPLTEEEGYKLALQESDRMNSLQIANSIHDADFGVKDDFDRGWIRGCRYVLRLRGWTVEDFERNCL